MDGLDGIVAKATSMTVDLGGQRIIEKVSLEVGEGEAVGLVGPNGVGKTTLLKTLAGLIKPSEGRVELREKAFMVPQSDLLLPWKTLRDNILISHPSPHSREAEDSLARVSRLLMLEEHLDKYPRHVSGGTRRKAAIARALLSGARLLLLDEPFTGLDVATVTVLGRHLRSLREKGYPMIVVSHQLAELSLLVDRVLIMAGKPGRIVGEVSFSKGSEAADRLQLLREALERALGGASL